MVIDKVDVLAIGVHPDDVEMGSGATIAKMVEQGRRVGILDLTRGELGTRGTPELRRQEAIEAMRVIGARWRIGLDLGDGFFEINKANKLQVVEVIRRAQPEIVLANAIRDRHPDHGRAARLVREAIFLSGLAGIELTTKEGSMLERWRPRAAYNYIQDYNLEPDVIVAVEPQHMDIRREAILSFKSQFYDPNSTELDTPLSTPYLINQLDGRCLSWGRQIGAQFGEGFNIDRFVGVNDIFDLL